MFLILSLETYVDSIYTALVLVLNSEVLVLVFVLVLVPASP